MFADVAAHIDIKDLDKRATSDKVLKCRAYKILINLEYNGCK